MKMRIVSLIVLLMLVGAVGVLAQGDLPTAEALDEGLNYLTIEGGTCARGTPYTFAAKPGDPEKLMIYFQGGGACWNLSTCRVGGTFDDSAEAGELDFYEGVFEFDNPENPVADYSMVVVTYCTADVHTGDAEAAFGEGEGAFDIAFRGVANTNAVLDWTYANYPDVTNLIVTGSSAGAYGAIYHAAGILSHYSDAQSLVMGDAGIGVTVEGWAGLDTWNIMANVPDAADFGEVREASFTRDLYANGAAMFPDVTFAEYTTYADQVQVGFYFLMGGLPLDWMTIMEAALDDLNQLPNFKSYEAWGDTHTILASPLFYTMQVNGIRFTDWFAGLVNGETVENVKCEDCRAEEFYTP